jgi:hypothetical protein
LGSPLDENRPSFKNFSILETELIDYQLSPAYDLLNSRIHVKDTDFALDQGLLPSSMRRGQIATQFAKLADLAGISPQIFDQVIARWYRATSRSSNWSQHPFSVKAPKEITFNFIKVASNGSARP